MKPIDRTGDGKEPKLSTYYIWVVASEDSDEVMEAMEAYPAKGMLRCGYKLRGVAAALQLQVV
jgi:hypothetical protein